MLFVRLIMLLLLPVRLPFMLLGRLFRVGKSVDHAAAQVAGPPATGAVGRTRRSAKDSIDVRYGVFFKIFTCPDSDEPSLGPNDLRIAEDMAQRAQEFYKLRADLFPPDDIFYEEVETNYIDKVSRIDNHGEKDQFVATLDQARRITNDNTRMLFCELAPLVLCIVLLGYAAMMLFAPPLQLGNLLPEMATDEASRLVEGAIAFVIGIVAVSFVYWFSYTHIQRANALSLNVFITTEFAQLNNAFRVAQREALQAETQLADTQKEELRKVASSWTLAYHWVGLRLFLEEMVVRNTMFQVRRNTTLYMALGILICLAICAVVALAATLTAVFLPGLEVHWGWAPSHLAVAALAFMFVAYALIMRHPFAIIKTSLMKDQWYRYDRLGVGDSIAEQVTRDKVQIVINRDRARAAGV